MGALSSDYQNIKNLNVPNDIKKCLEKENCDINKRLILMSRSKDPPKLTRDLFDIIEDVNQDEDQINESLCEYLDDQIIDNEYKGIPYFEELDSFLRKKCHPSLYHGTTRNSLWKSDGYICPMRGEFVSNMYQEDAISIPELVYATDRYRMGRAFTAILHRCEKCDTPNEKEEFIKKNGALLKLDSESFRRVNPYFESLEDDDYVSEECASVEGVITGDKLVSLYRKSESKSGVIIDIMPRIGWNSYDQFKEAEKSIRKKQQKMDVFFKRK